MFGQLDFATGRGRFGLNFLLSERRRRMRFCKYIVNTVLITYFIDVVEANFNGSVRLAVSIDFKFYEDRLKSSWTGGSAPLLCRGKR
jgi:hypothetical protein